MEVCASGVEPRRVASSQMFVENRQSVKNDDVL